MNPEENRKTSKSEPRLYFQVRESANYLYASQDAFDYFVYRFRKDEAENFESQVQIQKRRLKALHRLDICRDLDPNDDIDLMRLWLERTIVLTIDGGGYYILWTLQLLKELEEIANSAEESGPRPFHEPLLCRDLFDVVAGTSMGSIAAALIVKGRSAVEIEKFMIQEMPAMHQYRNPLHGIVLGTLMRMNLRLLHDGFRKTLMSLDPPLLDKSVLREWARKEFGDEKLGAYCERNNTGLFIISKNVQSGHTVPAGALLNPFRSYNRKGRVQCEKGHDDVLVRAALEAAVSPPLARQPLGQFIDAGYGSDADPTLVVLGHIFQLRNRREKEAIRRGAEAEEGFKEILSVSELLGDLEIILTRQVLKIREFSQIALHHKKTTVVFSFSTSFARAEQIPVKMIQKPLYPALFWPEWLVNDFYLKGSQNVANLLNDPANFPHLDYRRFNLTLGEYTLRGSNTLGPFATRFGRLPGISGTTTATVTDEDLYYLRSLVDGAYMPFYIAVGKATVGYLRARAKRLLDSETDRPRGSEHSRYLERLGRAHEECRRAILFALSERDQAAAWDDRADREMNVYAIFFKPPPDYDHDSTIVSQLEWRQRDFYLIAAGLTTGLWGWPDKEKRTDEVKDTARVRDYFVEHFVATIVFRGTLISRAARLREVSRFPDSREITDIVTKLLEEWRRARGLVAEETELQVPEEFAWLREFDVVQAVDDLRNLGARIFEAAREKILALMNLYSAPDTFFEEYRESLLPAGDPEEEFKPMINSFKFGLRGELLDYQANPYIPQQADGARDRIGRELSETLGDPAWVDAQPPNEPRQGVFAFPLPSLIPPYFQEHDHPARRWNPFSKEYDGDH